MTLFDMVKTTIKHSQQIFLNDIIIIKCHFTKFAKKHKQNDLCNFKFIVKLIVFYVEIQSSYCLQTAEIAKSRLPRGESFDLCILEK